MKNYKAFEQDSFVENETIVYHYHYGEGYFKSFPDHHRIKIEFPNDGEKIFEYPSCFLGVLSLEKSTKIVEIEKKESNDYYKNENRKEKEHFDNIKQITSKELLQAINEESDKKTEYNDYSSNRNPNLFKEHQILLNNVNKWRKIDNNPYFARVDYQNNKETKTIYIGKEEIPGHVIAWTSPESSMYYLYKVHSADTKINPLKLVRDFDIELGKYFSFIDKLNRYINDNEKEFDEALIADERLLNIIKYNKSSKKAHDIINTIQINQYKMIIHDANANILILGCAGSGKTMIMLHRLSFMAVNKNIDLKNTFIITPTDLLNLEVDELSKNLNINKANRFSSLELNKRIVQKFYSENKIAIEETSLISKNIKYNFDISPNILKIIYSKEFADIFIKKLLQLLNNSSKEKQKFIDRSLDKLIKKYNITNLNDKYILLNQKLFIGQETNYLEYCQIVKTISLYKINREYNSLSVQIKNNKSKGKNYLKYECQKAILEIILKYNKDLLNNNSDYYIGYNDVNLNKLYKFFYVSTDDNMTKNNKQNYKEKYNFIYQYNKFENERNLLREYAINNNNKIYFDYIVNEILEESKKAAKIDDNYYEYEFFFKVYACNKIFKQAILDKKYILIDEIQDYSYLEIETYKKLFPNSIFNYYGDIKQNINPKGMLEEEIHKLTSNKNIFNINENYRNAYEITQYINERFKMNMTPIGIKGKVIISDLNKIKNILKPNNEDRIAIIVKNKEIAEKYLSDLENTNNLFYGKKDISKEKINIISIMLAKGLEFEKVVVIEENMTTNELYVAQTRALDKLYIINKI